MIEAKKTYAPHNSVVLDEYNLFKVTEHSNGRWYLTLKEFNDGDYIPKRGNSIEKIRAVVFDTLYENKGSSFDEIMKKIKNELSTNRQGFHKIKNGGKLLLFYKKDRICYVPKEHFDDVLLFCENTLLLDLETGSITIEDVKHTLNDTFSFIHVRFRKTKTENENQSTLDFTTSVKLEKQLEKADAEIYDLSKQLTFYKKFEMLLRMKKEFKCPNCGAPLKFIQLFNGKETNKGRLAICCTDKKRKNEKGKCAYLRPLDELDYYVFHDAIIYHSSFDIYVPNEWEVRDSKHPNLIAPKILEWYKCFIESDLM